MVEMIIIHDLLYEDPHEKSQSESAKCYRPFWANWLTSILRTLWEITGTFSSCHLIESSVKSVLSACRKTIVIDLSGLDSDSVFILTLCFFVLLFLICGTL